MCARLKWNSLWAQIREKVLVHSQKGEKSCPWTGFARSEKEGWWKQRGAVRVVIRTDAFEEQGNVCEVKGEMQALGLNKDIIVNNKYIGQKGEVKILTRAAMTKFEKAVHDRWPVVYQQAGSQKVMQQWVRANRWAELPFDDYT